MLYVLCKVFDWRYTGLLLLQYLKAFALYKM